MRRITTLEELEALPDMSVIFMGAADSRTEWVLAIQKDDGVFFSPGTTKVVSARELLEYYPDGPGNFEAHVAWETGRDKLEGE